MKKKRISHLKVKERADFVKQMEKLDRRTFVKLSSLFSLASTLPLASCITDRPAEISAERNPKLLSEMEWNTLIEVQEHLFPHEKNAPGAHDVNAAGFFQWVLDDPLLDPKEISFKKNGLTWLNEESEEIFQKSFVSLNEKEKEETLKSLVSHSWGRSWVSVMLLHIFEALLSDPIYAANTNEKGWKWLNYTPGIPKSEEGKTYLNYTLADGSQISKK